MSRFAKRLSNEHGGSLIELSLLLPMLMLLFVGAVDLGRAYYLAIEVSRAAQAGTIYGIRDPTDISGMETASDAGASNLSNASATATYGCECSDGSASDALCGSPPTCTYNYVSYVDVVTSAQYVPIFIYPGLPSTLTISREVRMRVGGD